VNSVEETTTEMPKTYTTRSTCRVCYSDTLSPLFTLGSQYVNNFITPDQLKDCVKAPLEMIFCENCTLVQLKDTAPQELLYTGFYWYKSGVTETMKKALRDITEKAEKLCQLKEGDVALDIGSNDGTMLRTYQVPGLITVGVEPASNLAEEGKVGLTHHIHDFWNIQNYMNIVGKKAKVVTAIGMFYDMEDPNQFLADACNALTEDGVFIAQLMCSKNMLDKNDVGNICHEHLEFYSYASLEYFFDKNGLEIFDVEINNVNGESYRLYARKKGTKTAEFPGAAERVAAVKEDEKELLTHKAYLDFFNRIEAQKKKCVDFIKKEVAKGKKVWVFGASTKGNVILQYYGLDHTIISGASERSPWKWGKYTVGSMIPISSEDAARAEQPDYFLVLPYAFFDEMYSRETEWLSKGGKFIVPLPECRVVGMENGERVEYDLEDGELVGKVQGSAPMLNEGESTDPTASTETSITNQKPSTKKKVLIMGITGQDGSYLAEILLEKGYEVHGFIRKSSTGNTKNITHLMNKITLHRGDLADMTSIYKTVSEVQPDEIYNEADQDHVSWSYHSPLYSCDITGAGVVRILEAIKQINPKIKFFQPVSSNMFGQTTDERQTEETPFRPQSPYGAAKAFAYVMCRYYRDVFGLHVSTGIFYNHESPRRTEEYVTGKIVNSVARIKKGKQDKLMLGNLDATIDFGYAKEYMELAWRIMQLEKADDFIVCTGEAHSLKELLHEAFSYVGLNPDDYVEFDPRFARPGKTSALIGDTSKLQREVGTIPKVMFKELVKILMDAALERADDHSADVGKF
jgi:GDP-mannose 4,6-dehydratase